jgi:hypothetical protein
MVNELARRQQRRDTTMTIEYYFQYFSPRRYADLVQFGNERLTVYEAKTRVFDLGETIRGLRDAGHVLPLYESTCKYRTISSVHARLVLLATAENADLVVDNIDMLATVFGDGRTPGPDGVSYSLSMLDPLDGQSGPVRVIPIRQVSAAQLGALLARITPYEDKAHFDRTFWEQRRSREAVAVGGSGSDGDI